MAPTDARVRDLIIRFLMETRTGKKSDRAVREMIAEKFGGTLTSNRRYVKIGDDEYMIRRDADDPSLCGFEVRKMDWSQNGNDWRYFSPY